VAGKKGGIRRENGGNSAMVVGGIDAPELRRPLDATILSDDMVYE